MLLKKIIISVALTVIPSISIASIKIGVLHSLTGTMAISETELKETVEMLVEDQNNSGGLLGEELEIVYYDPESNWDKFAVDAKKLLVDDKVAAIFGCWTSVSRKKVLPVVEKYNGILFYPVQFEGEEISSNIFYSGATPNQQAIPAVKYFLDKGYDKFFLIGTDYVYPQTTNNILKNYLLSKGVNESDIVIEYTPFGFKDWGKIISKLENAAEDKSKKSVVISTINGDANIYFYKMLTESGINADVLPVMAFSVGENELKGMDTGPLVGHFASWNYFMSSINDENDDFISKWYEFKDDDTAVTNDPIEATYINFKLWVKAVEKAGSTDVEKVKEAIRGLKVKGLSGYEVKMDNNNHHLHKPVFIGEIQEDGQFDIIWTSEGLVEPAPINNSFKLCSMPSKDYLNYVEDINKERAETISSMCAKDENFKLCDLPDNMLSNLEKKECLKN